MTADEICSRFPLIETELREHLLPSLGGQPKLSAVRKALAETTTFRPDASVALTPLGEALVDRLEGLSVALPGWREMDKSRTLAIAALLPAFAFPDTPRELKAFAAIAETLVVNAWSPAREVLNDLLGIGFRRWEWLHGECMEAMRQGHPGEPERASLAAYGTINIGYSRDVTLPEALRERSRMTVQRGTIAPEGETPKTEPVLSVHGSGKRLQAHRWNIRVYHDLDARLGLPGIAVTLDARMGKEREIYALCVLPDGRVAFSIDQGRGGDRDLFDKLAEQISSGRGVDDERDWPECIRVLLPPWDETPEGIRLLIPQTPNSMRVPATVLDEAFAKAGLPESVLSTVAAARSIRNLSLKSFKALSGDGEGKQRLRAFTIENPLVGEVIIRSRSMTDRFLSGEEPVAVLREDAPHLTQAHLRRLKGVSGYEIDAVERVGVPREDNGMLLLWYFSGVSPDWAPGRHGWGDLMRAASLDMMVSLMLPDLPRGDLLNGCAGRWREYVARVCHHAEVTQEQFDVEHREIIQKIKDLRDAPTALARDVLQPLFARRRGAATQGDAMLAQEMAVRILYAGKSLPRVLETSARWHARLTAIRAGLPGTRLDAWKPLCRTVRMGDVEIVPLTAPHQVVEEGARGPDSQGVFGMAHCVAGNTVDYASGSRHLCSVRRVTTGEKTPYVRLSTGEFKLTQQDGIAQSLVLTEHRARNNTTPCRESAEAVKSFMKAVEDGSIELTPGLNDEREAAAVMAAAREYDWSDDALIEQALRAWEICLPRRLRGLALDDFPLDVAALDRPRVQDDAATRSAMM